MKQWVRTGIDLGHGSVRLVRGEGGSRLERITHIGDQLWDGDCLTDPEGAADALLRLVKRLGLNKWKLGRIAASVSGQEVSIREIVLPVLTEEELRRALPYEARKQLSLEEMRFPILDCQILGPAPPDDGDGHERMRVLMAAVSESARNSSLSALSLAGLRPEVVDPEPLAALNALTASQPFRDEADLAVALLDLGTVHASLSVVHREGDLFHRALGVIGPAGQVAPGEPAHDPGSDAGSITNYAEALGAVLLETLTWYRGKFRRAVGRVFLAGEGSLLPGIERRIHGHGGLPVEVFNPLFGLALASRVAEQAVTNGPRFTTACGLCRWWDRET